MKKMNTVTAVCLTFSAVFGTSPEVNNVTLSQDDSARTVITYELKGEPAIVTVDIQTNSNFSGGGAWISIGAENMVGISGDVHQRVDVTADGEHRTIVWHPETDWPGKRVQAARAVVKAWPTNSPPDWMVIDLKRPFTVAWYPDAAFIPFGGVTNQIYKDEYLVMRRIHAKGVVWTMGTHMQDIPASVTIGDYIRGTEKVRKVCLSDDYYIGVYELTGSQRNRVNATDGVITGSSISRLPLNWCNYSLMRGSSVGVAWPVYTDGVFDFEESSKVDSGCWIDTFRKRYAGYGIRIDLPTSAQWEYACRAGEGKPLYSGETYNQANVMKLARCSSNKNAEDCEGKTSSCSTVGSYEPNRWGLYDMYGNVMEQCLDVYELLSSIDDTKVYVDPVGAARPESGAASRLFRGNYYDSSWTGMRSGGYIYSYADTAARAGSQGYRLVWTLR